MRDHAPLHARSLPGRFLGAAPQGTGHRAARGSSPSLTRLNATVNMLRSDSEQRRIFAAIIRGARDRADKLAQARILQGRQRLLPALDVPATPTERRRT